MLYRTHHHTFLYTFNPSLSSHLLPSPPSSSNPLQKMECLHGGFLSGFGSETPFKTASFMDEFPAVNGDDLFVDELLDFSNDFEEDEMEPPQPQKLDEPEEDEPDKAKTCLEKPEKSVLSVKDDFGSLPESELSVPAEGLESLEWLSHFVEDSFSDYSLTGKLLSATNRPEPETSTKEQQACFITQVHTKARTKRARTGIRVWPVLSSSFTDSSTSSSSSTSATSFSVPNFPWPVHSQTGEFFKPPTKKQPKKKKPADAAGGGSTQPRRCGHCGVTKTPQWRAGPMGSKTLCNACGVRYKSGRLLPEYRPACSPTFSNELHSNNHRKVLEMRRKKETEVEAGPGLDPPVQSF